MCTYSIMTNFFLIVITYYDHFTLSLFESIVTRSHYKFPLCLQMHVIQWLLSTLCMYTVFETHTCEVYFIYQNDVSITYDSWLLTYTYDMGPYEEYIELLSREVLKFYNDIAFKVETFHTDYFGHFKAHLNWTLQVDSQVEIIHAV